MTTVALDRDAASRLSDLGLSYSNVQEALLRADAEARMTTDLDPPTAEGITRYIKTNRFLREQLLPVGWDYSNANNFCRTINPARTLAIVASSGDDYTGVYIPGLKPSTKYPKGETTVRAVATNQLAFDLGADYTPDDPGSDTLPVWYLLYRLTTSQIFVELSRPSHIEAGRIIDWSERIILEPIERTPFPSPERGAPWKTSRSTTSTSPCASPGWSELPMLNASRLTAARKRRGWTITKLAGATGLSTQSLSTYENARQEPSPKVIALLAERLGVATDFLTGDDLDEIPLEAVSFRALSKMTARTRDRGLASGRVAIMINEWIESRFQLPEPELPTLTGRNPEAAAQELRVRWGLGEQPIGNLVHLLEAHGVRIYALTHANTDLDAFSLHWHGRPFVFLSTEKSPERGRFDAAHELGHLVLHGEDREPHGTKAEQEANQFAAAFLMPRAGILAQGLRSATVDRVLVAKRRWNVAAMALAHRLNELDLMTEWGYRSLCVNLSRRGYRRGEPEGMAARESSQLLTKVLQQLRATGSGVQEIASDPGLRRTEIQGHLIGLTPIVITGGGSNGHARILRTLHVVD